MYRSFTVILLTIISTTCLAQDAWKAPSEADKLKSPFALDNEKTIAKGEKIFGKMCWTCHGEYGKGDGAAAEALDPKPADLTSAKVQAQTDGAFYWKITHGRGAMVGYEEIFSDDQRWQLVAFIRSLPKENE